MTNVFDVSDDNNADDHEAKRAPVRKNELLCLFCRHQAELGLVRVLGCKLDT